MTGRVLANAGVFALGLILILGGAWGIWSGSEYIQIERGWSSVISGSVAVTGGVLTLAMAFVLWRLDSLHRTLVGFGAGAIAIAEPVHRQPALETAAEPMPLDLGSAAEHTPEPAGLSSELHGAAPEPQVETVDPAVQAAAAINLALLEQEARQAEADHGEASAHPQPASELGSTEAPPEVVYAADQGPADDMVRAGGGGDEPELDAAIEELLAAERSKPAAEPRQAPSEENEEKEKKKENGRSWRGLFSRKQRGAGSPAEPSHVLPEKVLPLDPQSEDEAAPPQQMPLSTEAIPKTGDDWFDRALSGVDEVETAPNPSGKEQLHAAGYATDHGEKTMASAPEAHEASADEPPAPTAPSVEPAVIGRYTSGNTTYVMFSDGSIQAETPTGVLRFASLADLKVYVEGGN